MYLYSLDIITTYNSGRDLSRSKCKLTISVFTQVYSSSAMHAPRKSSKSTDMSYSDIRSSIPGGRAIHVTSGVSDVYESDEISPANDLEDDSRLNRSHITIDNRDRFLGQITISLDEIPPGDIVDEWRPLEKRSNRSNVQGALMIGFNLFSLCPMCFATGFALFLPFLIEGLMFSKSL